MAFIDLIFMSLNFRLHSLAVLQTQYSQSLMFFFFHDVPKKQSTEIHNELVKMTEITQNDSSQKGQRKRNSYTSIVELVFILYYYYYRN